MKKYIIVIMFFVTGIIYANELKMDFGIGLERYSMSAVPSTPSGKKRLDMLLSPLNIKIEGSSMSHVAYEFKVNAILDQYTITETHETTFGNVTTMTSGEYIKFASCLSLTVKGYLNPENKGVFLGVGVAERTLELKSYQHEGDNTETSAHFETSPFLVFGTKVFHDDFSILGIVIEGRYYIQSEDISMGLYAIVGKL